MLSQCCGVYMKSAKVPCTREETYTQLMDMAKEYDICIPSYSNTQTITVRKKLLLFHFLHGLHIDESMSNLLLGSRGYTALGEPFYYPWSRFFREQVVLLKGVSVTERFMMDLIERCQLEYLAPVRCIIFSAASIPDSLLLSALSRVTDKIIDPLKDSGLSDAITELSGQLQRRALTRYTPQDLGLAIEDAIGVVTKISYNVSSGPYISKRVLNNWIDKDHQMSPAMVSMYEELQSGLASTRAQYLFFRCLISALGKSMDPELVNMLITMKSPYVSDAILPDVLKYNISKVSPQFIVEHVEKTGQYWDKKTAHVWLKYGNEYFSNQDLQRLSVHGGTGLLRNTASLLIRNRGVSVSGDIIDAKLAGKQSVTQKKLWQYIAKSSADALLDDTDEDTDLFSNSL